VGGNSERAAHRPEKWLAPEAVLCEVRHGGGEYENDVPADSRISANQTPNDAHVLHTRASNHLTKLYFRSIPSTEQCKIANGLDLSIFRRAHLFS
jgi:hypothetical protein